MRFIDRCRCSYIWKLNFKRRHNIGLHPRTNASYIICLQRKKLRTQCLYWSYLILGPIGKLSPLALLTFLSAYLCSFVSNILEDGNQRGIFRFKCLFSFWVEMVENSKRQFNQNEPKRKRTKISTICQQNFTMVDIFSIHSNQTRFLLINIAVLRELPFFWSKTEDNVFKFNSVLSNLEKSLGLSK